MKVLHLPTRLRTRTAASKSRRNALRTAIESLESRTMLSSSWQSVPIGGGGFVTGLVASSTGSGIYMRTDVGGAYRWDSANTQWDPITDSLPNDTFNNGPAFGIASLAVDPNNANRLFIAAGKYASSSPAGIYVCTDASVASPTWTNIDSTLRAEGNGGLRQSGERLLVDPNNSNVVYYGTYNLATGGSGLKKLYYDTAWHTTTLTTPAVGDTDYGISFVAADKTGGTVSDGTRTVSKYLYIGVFSTTAGNGGVYASSNGGASWTKVTGVAVDKPYRGEVGPDGTLYVTFNGTFAGNGGVVKLARGATTFTSIAPGGNLAYCGLAVDPTAAGTVMVAEYAGSDRIWRSINGGSSWALLSRNTHATEPDGTPSVTSNAQFDHIADLMINPANPDEVWASDFLGVQRTQDIKDDTSASDWYMLQKGHEEIVNLDLASAPGGSPLLSAVADVNGFAHDDPDVRPASVDKFETPAFMSTTGLDFSEATSGDSTVWARVGDTYYSVSYYVDAKGGFSLDDGQNWGAFGQVSYKPVANSATAGWETWDVGPYLQQQKAAGINQVTLVLQVRNMTSSHAALHFSSREGSNAPQLLLNGSTTLTPTADAYVVKGSANNYGNSTELQAQNYSDQNNYTRWSYIKFDLSSVASIGSATLRLYRPSSTDTSSFITYVYATPTTNWVEGNGGSDNNPSGEIVWTNRPTNLTAPPSGATGGHVAISASDPAKMVWVAENGYLWYTKDRGVTWGRGTYNGSNLSLDQTSEFQMFRNGVASDRVAADTFYAYSTTGGGTVYRSTNGGATWSVLASGIGSVSGSYYPAGYRVQAAPGMSGQLWFSAMSLNSSVAFKYWNGSSMVSVSGISGVVDFAFGKAAPGKSNPTVFVRKSDGTYWYSTDATAGSTFTWTQVDVPALNDAPGVMEGDRQTFGRFYVGTNGRGIFYTDAVSTYTWDGGPGGTGTSWNVAANWSPDGIPGATSTVIFTDAGLSSGKTITLDANQAVDHLVIATTTGFTLGSGSTYSLSLNDLDRQDVAGTESGQTFAAPVALLSDSTWTVAGSGALLVNGGISGAYDLTKQGTGELDVGANSYSGDTTVLAGTLKATANGAIPGNLVIGGGASAAIFTSSTLGYAIANSADITVNSNGTASLGNAENFGNLIVNGGTFNGIYPYINGTITMTGGTLDGTGSIYGNHHSITTNASSSMASITLSNSLYAYADSTFDVADGAADIDLKITKGLSGGSTSRALTKSGAGVMVLSGSSGQANGTFSVTAGTLLVNNASGSGTGQSAVSVSAAGANATLGGVGTIGGVSGYTNANVALAGSASYTATLAPGTIDESTGAHIPGTLTVGSASQGNDVTFDDHSRLLINLFGDANDRLTVYGDLTLDAGATLVISASGLHTLADYTLASWTGTRTGTFASVSGLPAGYELVYGANSITLRQAAVLWAGPSGGSWNDADNWDPTGVPEAGDNVRFTTGSGTITLDASQQIDKLILAQTGALTLSGGSGDAYSLTLTHVQREDVSGTESNQTIDAPVILAADSTWRVDGDGQLIVSAPISGNYTLEKLGAGELRFNYPGTTANSYAATVVSEGTLSLTNANTNAAGDVTIGGGASAAILKYNPVGYNYDGIGNSNIVTVKNNGTLDLSAYGDNRNDTIGGLVVEQGGVVNMGDNTTRLYVIGLGNTGVLTMKGGAINGTAGSVDTGHVTVDAANAATSTINATLRTYSGSAAQAVVTVNDASPVIDLKITGLIADFAANYDYGFEKAGGGVMKITASNTYGKFSGTTIHGSTKITGGTLLVDNTTGSGTGQGDVNVSGDATLGGIGFIGGVSGYSGAVSLTGSSGHLAILAPGDLNESTGAHILGTLTIGGGAQANNVSFNGYSKLAINLSGNSLDHLVVNGNLTLGASNTTLALSASGTQTLASYTLASWTGTRTGTFDNVTGIPAGYQLVYGSNDIRLVQTDGLMAMTYSLGNMVSPTISKPVNHPSELEDLLA